MQVHAHGVRQAQGLIEREMVAGFGASLPDDDDFYFPAVSVTNLPQDGGRPGTCLEAPGEGGDLPRILKGSPWDPRPRERC